MRIPRIPRKSPASDPRVKLALARLMLERTAAPAPDDGPEPVWAPDPDNLPQCAACASEAQVIGYGGAAGGGKTDMLIGLAMTKHRNSIIFRRESTQLKAIIKRAKELGEGHIKSFNHNDLVMTLKDGRTIEFGAMKDPDDWEKFKGRPHDLKSYDEPTELLEKQFRASSAWLRTTILGQRTRIVLAFNPPTNVQGMWIIRYFAPWLDPTHHNPAKPGELRWFATVGGKEDTECEDGEPFAEFNPDGSPALDCDGKPVIIHPMSRTFYPARLADNKYLMRTDYGRTLMNTPEPLRSQLLYGSFEASMLPDPWQVIPTAWIDLAMERWKVRDRATVGPLTCIGLDVAHGGKDKTVVAPRHGDFIDTLRKVPGRDTPDGMSAAKHAMEVHRDGAYINVDVIGYGASAHERLADSPPEGFGVRAQPINFAMRSEHTDKSGKYRMVNVRAEAYWRLREELDPEQEGGATLCLPPDSELRNELAENRYEITTVGIKIEPKDDIVERLGHSPDCGDAVALTCLPDGSPMGATVAGKLADLAPQPERELVRPALRIPGMLG